jgi:hypothetical protein
MSEAQQLSIAFRALDADPTLLVGWEMRSGQKRVSTNAEWLPALSTRVFPAKARKVTE